MQKDIFLLFTILVATNASPYYRENFQYQEQSESYKNNELQHKKEEAGKIAKFGDGVSDPIERSAFHKSEYHAPGSEDDVKRSLALEDGLNNQRFEKQSSYQKEWSSSGASALQNQNSRLLIPPRPSSGHGTTVQEPFSYGKEWGSHSSWSYGPQNPTTTHLSTSASQSITQQKEEQQRIYGNSHFGSGTQTAQQNSDFGRIQTGQTYRPENTQFGQTSNSGNSYHSTASQSRLTGMNTNTAYSTPQTYRPDNGQYEQALNSGSSYHSTAAQSRLTGINTNTGYSTPDFGTQSTDNTGKISQQRTKTYLITSTNNHDIKKPKFSPESDAPISDIRVVPSTSNTATIKQQSVRKYTISQNSNNDDISTDTAPKISGVPVISFPNHDRQQRPYKVPQSKSLTSDDYSTPKRITEVPVNTYVNQYPVNVGIVPSTTEQPLPDLEPEEPKLETNLENEQQIRTGSTRRVQISTRPVYPAIRTVPNTEQTSNQQTRTFQQSEYSRTHSYNQNQQNPLDQQTVPTSSGPVYSPRYPSIRTVPKTNDGQQSIISQQSEYSRIHSESYNQNPSVQQGVPTSAEPAYSPRYPAIRIAPKIDTTHDDQQSKTYQQSEYSRTHSESYNQNQQAVPISSVPVYSPRYSPIRTVPKTDTTHDDQQSEYSRTHSTSYIQNQQHIPTDNEPEKDYNTDDLTQKVNNDFGDLQVGSQKIDDSQKVSKIPENKPIGGNQQNSYVQRTYRAQRTQKTEFVDNPTTAKPHIPKAYQQYDEEPTQQQQKLNQDFPQHNADTTAEDLFQHHETKSQTTQKKYHATGKVNRQHDDLLLGIVPTAQNGAQGSTYSSSSAYSKSRSFSTGNQQSGVVFSPVQVGTKSGELQLYQTMQIPAGTSEETRQQLQEQMRHHLEQKMQELQSQYSTSRSSRVTFSPIRINSNSGTGEYQVYQTVQLPAGSTAETRQQVQEQMRQQLQQKLQELMQQQSQSYQQPILVKSFGGESYGADCDDATGGTHSSSYTSQTGGNYRSVRPGSSYSVHYPVYHSY